MNTTTIIPPSAISVLQKLGFTDYEARAYLALVEGGEMSGYALAKLSGIPRPNVYAVIEKLIERGAVSCRLDEAGQRYAPVPPGQLLAGIEADQRRRLAEAGQVLAEHPHAKASRSIYNVSGGQLLVKARQLVESCRRSLLVAIQPADAAELSDSLHAASARGVAVTTLCLQNCAHECGGCVGSLHRHPIMPGGTPRWLVVVADESTSLVGQLDAAAADGALTQQRPMVELAAAYIRQTIALAVLGCELAAEHFQDLLSSQAKTLLEKLSPGGDDPPEPAS
ncbi:MAG: TrmB family transcriptional regulator [Steroidobacteraceae bacterium]